MLNRQNRPRKPGTVWTGTRTSSVPRKYHEVPYCAQYRGDAREIPRVLARRIGYVPCRKCCRE